MLIARKVKLLLDASSEAVVNSIGKDFADLYNFIAPRLWALDTKDKKRMHHAVYYLARAEFPEIKAQYVISAITKAKSSVLSAKARQKEVTRENNRKVAREEWRVGKGLDPKPVKLRKDVSCPQMRKADTILLDARLVNIKTGEIQLTTRDKKLKIPYQTYGWIEDHRPFLRKGCELNKKKGIWYLTLFFDLPEPSLKTEGLVVGVDRGIINPAVVGDVSGAVNLFHSSKQRRNVKGRYLHNRQNLQAKGTRSAHRKLKKLSGRENRFVQDANHCLSKAILAIENIATIVLEELSIESSKANGKSFNKKLGSWSPSDLEAKIRYKAALAGIAVISVDPAYTSQTCSRCLHCERGNRQGSNFECKQCGFKLNADLNAARNIAALGQQHIAGSAKSGCSRLPGPQSPVSTSPTVRHKRAKVAPSKTVATSLGIYSLGS